MNYSAKLNLLRLPAAKMMNVGGETCVVINANRCDLFLTADETGKPKGAFLDLAIFEQKEPSKYGDTHLIKQSHSKEWNEARSDEERKAEPIIGNVKPFGKRTVEASELPAADTEEPTDWGEMENDLPFPKPES